MKGKIETKTEREWKNPEGQTKKFFDITIEGIDKKYGCWQYNELAAKNVGDEIEFEETEKNGRWSMKLAGAAKGGGFQARGKSPEELKQQARSFSASYSKDLTVACIAAGIIKDSKGIDAAILHWNNLFRGILEG